jgi:uncharacterized membrane protein YecN with MAPEG domain
MGELMPESLVAVALYTGLNLLLLMVLGFNISLKRRASKIGIGDGGDEKLACAVRAHANHAEWFPAIMIGLVIVALIGIPAYAIHAVGAVFTLARLLHAWGMLSTSGVSFGRFVGSLLTYLSALVLGAGLILHAAI